MLGAAIAGGQYEAANSPVTISVADENGAAVAGARVTIVEPGTEPAQLWTDYAGNCRYTLRQREPYEIAVEKAGFYKADENAVDPNQSSVKVALEHEQIVREQVNVTASAPGIDIQQVGDQSTMNTPEIVTGEFAASGWPPAIAAPSNKSNPAQAFPVRPKCTNPAPIPLKIIRLAASIRLRARDIGGSWLESINRYP